MHSSLKSNMIKSWIFIDAVGIIIMRIGNVKIANRFVLAPMSAVNCTAFRMLCKENGAGLIYTYMIDADFIKGKTKKQVKKLLNINDFERPVNVQLIGNKKDVLVKAVKLVEDFADIIDFNVGCSEKKFMRKGYGVCLLSDLLQLEELVRTMVNSTVKPVTAKIRIGLDAQSINAVKVSKILENAGVKAICVHGRTAQQKYSGKVNWTIMKQVKQKVAIPVIANGDVKSYEQGLDLLGRTNCDFVMIGRAARHCPWIFDPKKANIDNEGMREQILRFIELYENYENRRSAQEVREHAFWMLRDFKTKQNTKKVLTFKSVDKIKNYVLSLK
ncbi:MAG: tRNA-dihydrouridine synthase family protein [Candidatus Bathyarchaeia archaeon]